MISLLQHISHDAESNDLMHVIILVRTLCADEVVFKTLQQVTHCQS